MSGPSSPAEEHREELVRLRETIRVFELTSAHNEMIAEQFRQLGRSRLFPLAVLLLKADNVAERFLRRRLGRVPADHAVAAAGPGEPDAPTSARRPASAAVTLVKGYRLLVHALAVLVRGHAAAGPAGQFEADPYGQWNESFARFDDELRRRLTLRAELIKDPPTFSIVMAAYDTDRAFLEQAIESVLAQVYERFELIVADDASSDPTVREVVEGYARRDPRIRLVTREANGGISAATNSAAAAATGEWLVFMDHDDTQSRQR